MRPLFLFFFESIPNFRLGVSIRATVRVTFTLIKYVYYVSTKPAFSLCFTVMLLEAVE